MFVLDTDHLGTLQRQAEPQFGNLMRRILQYPQASFSVTIVSFHEEVLGWNAYLARARRCVLYCGWLQIQAHPRPGGRGLDHLTPAPYPAPVPVVLRGVMTLRGSRSGKQFSEGLRRPGPGFRQAVAAVAVLTAMLCPLPPSLPRSRTGSSWKPGGSPPSDRAGASGATDSTPGTRRTITRARKKRMVGQAFQPDSEPCQAGKPDLLPCRVILPLGRGCPRQVVMAARLYSTEALWWAQATLLNLPGSRARMRPAAVPAVVVLIIVQARLFGGCGAGVL